MVTGCTRKCDYSIYVFYIGHGGDGEDMTQKMGHGGWIVTEGNVVEEDYITGKIVTSNLISLTNCTGCYNSVR